MEYKISNRLRLTAIVLMVVGALGAGYSFMTASSTTLDRMQVRSKLLHSRVKKAMLRKLIMQKRLNMEENMLTIQMLMQSTYYTQYTKDLGPHFTLQHFSL